MVETRWKVSSEGGGLAAGKSVPHQPHGLSAKGKDGRFQEPPTETHYSRGHGLFLALINVLGQSERDMGGCRQERSTRTTCLGKRAAGVLSAGVRWRMHTPHRGTLEQHSVLDSGVCLAAYSSGGQSSNL